MKTSLARTGGVLASTAALIGIGLSPAAAIHDGSAYAEANTASGTGIFSSIANLLQTGECTATFANGGPMVHGAGDVCTPSIDLSAADAIVRYATADVSSTTGAATSSAESRTAAITLDDLAANLNLTDILGDLATTSTVASALGPLLASLGQVGQALLAPLTTQIDGVLGPVLTQIDATLPLSVSIGAVEATCSATATTATGGSDIASVDINVDLSALGMGNVVVPMTIATTANADLIADVGQLADDILDGVEATLTQSDFGSLTALATLLGQTVAQVKTSIIDALITQLRPTLLQPLSDALAPIISGKINVTPDVATGTEQPFTAADEIDITALKLTILGTNTLNMAHVHCGDNVDGTLHGTPPAPSKTPDVPTIIDAGATGGGFGGPGMVAAMMVLGTAVGVAGHRLTRSLS